MSAATFPVAGHLLALIVGQGEAQRCRHRQQAGGEAIACRLRLGVQASLIRTSLRLVRSTNVPTEDGHPSIRSPSQCPGTRRSATAAARSRMLVMSLDPAPPVAILGPPTTMRLALAQAGEQLAPQLTARHG